MEALEIGLITAMSCILFMSLFGNIILLVVVHGQLAYHAIRNYSYLILNLAISDILLATSSIPFDIVERLKAPVFPFGATMCKLLWPFQTVCSMASIFTVGALSYQRYRLVVKPFKGKLPRRRFFVMLAAIWLLPVFLAGIPYSFALRFDQNSSFCFEEWIPASKQAQVKLSFTTYLFIIQYVLPLALIVWCNVKAIVELKRYLKYRKRTSMISALSIEHHENTVKMLTVIMAVFASFWLPGQVMAFLMEFENENEFILKYGLDIGYLFVFSNCVLNPLIFAYFSQCHKKSLLFRKLTPTSLNPTVACELGYSTFRRDSERNSGWNQQRRASLPGNLKRGPPARIALKRPSLPSILQSESITEVERKDLLHAKKNEDFTVTQRNSSVLPSKKQLPAVSEMQSSDTLSLMQTNDLQHENQNTDQPKKTQKRECVLVEIPKSNLTSLTQNGELRDSIQNSDPTQKRASIPNSRKKLSISFSVTSLTTQTDSNSFPNTLQQPRGQTDQLWHERPQKRSSFSILKKRDSTTGTQCRRDSIRSIHSEKNGDIDAGNRVMRNFLEIMKTMTEDVLRKYLDATPETVLN